MYNFNNFYDFFHLVVRTKTKNSENQINFKLHNIRNNNN